MLSKKKKDKDKIWQYLLYLSLNYQGYSPTADNQACQNDSRFKIYSNFVVIGGSFCYVKTAANDNTIRGNLKTGLNLTSLAGTSIFLTSNVFVEFLTEEIIAVFKCI